MRRWTRSYEIRARIVSDGKSPTQHRRLVTNLVNHGNAFGRSQTERSQWAAGLSIKDAGKESVDVLLHIGSQNAYDEQQWPGLVAIVGMLEKAGVTFGTLGNDETDGGGLAYELGYRDVAIRQARESSRAIRDSGANTLVTCCADSLAAFKNYHPRMGFSRRRPRYFCTEYIEKLLPRDGWQCGPVKRIVTYHDPAV